MLGFLYTYIHVDRYIDAGYVCELIHFEVVILSICKNCVKCGVVSSLVQSAHRLQL